MLPLLAALLLSTSGTPAAERPPPAPAETEAPPSAHAEAPPAASGDEAVIENLELLRAIDLLDTLDLLDDSGDGRDDGGRPR